MYVRCAWGQAPWSGTTLPPTDLGELPPPIPGTAATFSYASSLGAYPWAYASWAGGYPLPAYPGGGVLATPVDASGVMQLRAWWPAATTLQVVRMGPDGSRTPVRGGHPVTQLASATRYNWCGNPSIEAGTNGFVPDAGSPTLTRVVDAASPHGTAFLRATNAGSGSNGVVVPSSLTSPAAGLTVTVAFGLRTSAKPSSVTLAISWASSTGGSLGTTSATLTADQINASTGIFARQALTVAPPSGAVTPTVKITCGGMPAGGQMDLDAITIEAGPTDGSYFDGHTLGGTWSGAADLSASVLAPVHTLLDGECPLDTIVRYQAQFPGITGGRVVSDPAYLTSHGRAWLTHPGAPETPVEVLLTTPPALERALDHGVFWPLTGQYPIVVTSAQRRAPVGEIELVWLSFSERDALLSLLSSGSPLLLRAPSEFGFASMWLAFADVTEGRGERKAWQDGGVLSAEAQQVDRPSEL